MVDYIFRTRPTKKRRTKRVSPPVAAADHTVVGPAPVKGFPGTSDDIESDSDIRVIIVVRSATVIVDNYWRGPPGLPSLGQLSASPARNFTSDRQYTLVDPPPRARASVVYEKGNSRKNHFRLLLKRRPLVAVVGATISVLFASARTRTFRRRRRDVPKCSRRHRSRRFPVTRYDDVGSRADRKSRAPRNGRRQPAARNRKARRVVPFRAGYVTRPGSRFNRIPFDTPVIEIGERASVPNKDDKHRALRVSPNTLVTPPYAFFVYSFRRLHERFTPTFRNDVVDE